MMAFRAPAPSLSSPRFRGPREMAAGHDTEVVYVMADPDVTALADDQRAVP
jgi:hypothetical protein